MTIQPGANLYTQGFGSCPENVEVPVVTNVSPSSSNFKYPIGKRWINTVTNTEYVLTSISTIGGTSTATWTATSGGTSQVSTLTGTTGTATPVGGNIQIAGTANQIVTTASGSTVTLALTGPYAPATYTDHGVLVGSGTSDITALAVGTNGQVLTGNTGADPSFQGIGSLSGLADGGVILGGGAGPFTATALGTAGQVLTSNGAGVDPTFQTSAGGTTSDYADFYALMPGDNAATIAPGAAILLPQDGPSSGTSITRLSSSTFQLADIATYSVSFQCSFDEAGQWIVKLDGTELLPTTSGRATGTNQAYITCLVTTTGINSVISIVNPTGNATALTITPIAGGTKSASAHLVIQRVAGGPGGGLLNTINDIIPVAGNIDIAGTANQITVTDTAGTATISIPSAFTAPGSVTATTTLTATLGDITATNGNLVLTAAGNKMMRTSVATTTTAGANSIGSVTLVGGTATISTSSVTAGSLIQVWRQSVGATGAAALGQISVGTISAGVSFVINAWQAADATALQASDVSVIGWEIIN